MKRYRLLFILAGLLLWTSSNAQYTSFYPMKSFVYYLYSSEDRVYYYNKDKWEPVIYEETELEKGTIIKTDSPFTLIYNKRILFCPAAKEARTIEDLIKTGGSRNTIIDYTASRGVAIKVKALYDLHYLLIGANDNKNKITSISNGINETINANSKYNLGYNHVLLNDAETSKENILTTLNNLSDSLNRGYLLLYISSNGIMDKEGKYHIFTSDSRYDSLACGYINTITADTLNLYIEKIKSKGLEVCVFADVNNSDGFVQNLYHIDDSSATLWLPEWARIGDKRYIEYILTLLPVYPNSKETKQEIPYYIYYESRKE